MKPLDTLVAAAVLLQLVLLVAILLRNRRQKAIQDELVAAISGRPFWRIAITRPEHLERLWKLSAVQALGVLIDEGSNLRLRGRWNRSKEPFDVIVPKTAANHPVWQGRLSIRAGSFAWAKISSTTGDLMITAGSSLQPQASREALADILRSAFPGLTLPADAAQDFALEKNRRSVAAMATMSALFFFAALDTYVFNRYELIDSQIHALTRSFVPMALAAFALVAAGVTSHLALRQGKVPARESFALSMLVVVAAAFAALPALKRADQLLASGPTVHYPYRVADKATTLQPVDGTLGLPMLRFKRAPEYWAQFPVGAQVEIPLRHGGLGLWQLDHERFDPPVIEFYKKTTH